MSDLDHELLHEKLRAVADAELVSMRNTLRKSSVQVSALAQKAALMVLLTYEGEAITNNGLAARMGVCTNAAKDTVQILVQQGLVIVHLEHRRRRRYIVSMRRLLEMQTKHPLWTRGGRPNRERFHQAITNRKLRQALEPIIPPGGP